MSFKRISLLLKLGLGMGLFISMAILNPVNVQGAVLEDYFIFQQNNKKGLRNSDHEVVIPAKYDDLGWSIGAFHPLGRVLGYKENGLWGLITLENKRIGPAAYQNLYPLNRQLMVASVLDQATNQELYGIIDKTGLVVLDFQYGWISLFNNMVIASRHNGLEWKYGMIDLKYQEVLPFKYHQIKALNNQYAVITDGNFSGLVNARGRVVAPTKYHTIELQGNEFRGKLFDTYEIKNQQNQLLAKLQLKSLQAGSKGAMIATGNGTSQLLNPKGEILSTFPRTEVFEFNSNRVVIKRGELFGIVNYQGQELLTPKYRTIWMTQDFIGVQHPSGDWELLDTELRTISQKIYQQINPPTEGLFAIKRQNSWGYINQSGEEIIPPQYQKVDEFIEGQAMALYLGSWGVIDPNGNWLIMPRHDQLKRINPSNYLLHTDGYQGVVNTGNEITYKTFNRIRATPTGIVEENMDGFLGLVSLHGEKLLSLQYSSIDAFEEDPRYYRFKGPEGFGIFNIEQQKFFADTAIQEIRTLDEGYIGVRIHDQYGFIDLNGKLRIANRYEDVGVFNEDMLPVKIRGKWGYVDRIERLKVQPIYHTAGKFVNQLAIVSQNQQFGLINKSGKLVLSLDYDKIERLPGGEYICYKGNQAGLIDANGRVLLYPGYNSLQNLENGHLKISKGGKLGVITKQGKTLIPPLYDEISFDRYNQVYILTKKSPWDIIKL